MATLTLRNVPEPVYERLKKFAERNRRSLNSEVLTRLEQSVGGAVPDVEAEIARVERLRKFCKGPPVTPEQLKAMIESGRA
jgi:plasmid stability protein